MQRYTHITKLGATHKVSNVLHIYYSKASTHNTESIAILTSRNPTSTGNFVFLVSLFLIKLLLDVHTAHTHTHTHIHTHTHTLTHSHTHCGYSWMLASNKRISKVCCLPLWSTQLTTKTARKTHPPAARASQCRSCSPAAAQSCAHAACPFSLLLTQQKRPGKHTHQQHAQRIADHVVQQPHKVVHTPHASSAFY